MRRRGQGGAIGVGRSCDAAGRHSRADSAALRSFPSPGIRRSPPMIPRPRAPRVRRSTIFLILVTAALAFPVGVWANHQFDDVPTAASYHDDVEALVNAGVTS